MFYIGLSYGYQVKQDGVVLILISKIQNSALPEKPRSLANYFCLHARDYENNFPYIIIFLLENLCFGLEMEITFTNR